MYVISYDISDDKVRSKVAKILEGYGKRVQYSVFECDITKKQYNELYSKLGILIGDDECASVRFYYICNNCRDRITVMGLPSVDDFGNEDVIII